MKTKKALTPDPIYGGSIGYGGGEAFVTIMCYCPSCKTEVPYQNYCCECGQKFIKIKIGEDEEEDN